MPLCIVRNSASSNHPGHGSVLALLSVVAASFFSAPCLAVAQPPPAGDFPPLSRFEFPTQWIGSEPTSVASLRGKGVFLYFYEEDCPKCKKRWPELMAAAQEHAQDPIVFLAVNSGTAPQEVAAYARSVQLNWPVLVDSDRTFERLCNVGEISLQNVMQVAYITADGQLKRGQWKDIESTIKSALKGAKWNVDPAEVPPELRPAWRSLEFSKYSQAAPMLTKALKSSKPAIKTGAEKLSATVEERIERDLQAANKSADENHKLDAYQAYGEIAAEFAGYPAAEPAAARRRELAKDPAVKKELSALKQLEKLRPMLDSPKPAARERARVAIQKLIDSQPDSGVAQQARKLLGPPDQEEAAQR